MEQYQRDFIEFMVHCGVLTFGDFITKSGRRTPFFINTGYYNSGPAIARLGEFYAEAIMRHLPQADCLFGPAYKGIPLCVATAIALARRHNRDIGYAFNRKEAKDHGEGGALVGRRLGDGDRVIIVEDVTTAGTSVRESITLLRAVARVEVIALVVSVDRQEKGRAERSALAELREEFGLRTLPLVTLNQIIQHLHNREIEGRILLNDTILTAIQAYRSEYGARD